MPSGRCLQLVWPLRCRLGLDTCIYISASVCFILLTEWILNVLKFLINLLVYLKFALANICQSCRNTFKVLFFLTFCKCSINALELLKCLQPFMCKRVVNLHVTLERKTKHPHWQNFACIFSMDMQWLFVSEATFWPASFEDSSSPDWQRWSYSRNKHGRIPV